MGEPRRTIPKEVRPMNGADGVLHSHVLPGEAPRPAKIVNGLTIEQRARPYLLVSKDPMAIRLTGAT